MARHTKEWNDGYQAAIEAIKKQLENGGGGSSDGQGQELPNDMTSPEEATGGQGGQQDKSQNQSGTGNSGNSNSRTNPNDSSQGIVRPEDCCSNNSGVESTPGTPGGFFDKSEGDKLAQAEGYNKEGGSDGTVEQDWKEAAVRAANKISAEPGSAMGKLKSTIEGLHKVTTDWKNALKKIVGRSINPSDTRSAYANKNILVSQDRIARTEKDKYDNMDYMIALIDSSGSIGDEQLRMMLSEVYSVALAKKPIKLVIMQCDTKIRDIQEFRNLSELKKQLETAKVKGGGGTDFEDLWKILETDKRFRGRKPDLIMIFTDGYVNQLPRNRKTMNHLVWCIIDNPSFNVKYNDPMTKMIHINSADIK
jgi:hypothetical protein